MNKAPVKGQSRYGQVAQAATAVRSNLMMLLAFKPIPPTQSKAFDTPGWSIRESNPSPNVSARFRVSGGLLQ